MDFDCERIDRWLEAYRDGELPPASQQRVDAHLRGCPSCEARLAEVQAVGFNLAEALISDASSPGLMAKLGETVAKRIAEMGAAPRPSLWGRLRENVRAPIPIAAAAAVAIAVYLLVLMGSRASQPIEARQAADPPHLSAVNVHAPDPAVTVNFVDDREPDWTVVWISRTDSDER